MECVYCVYILLYLFFRWSNKSKGAMEIPLFCFDIISISILKKMKDLVVTRQRHETRNNMSRGSRCGVPYTTHQLHIETLLHSYTEAHRLSNKSYPLYTLYI